MNKQQGLSLIELMISLALGMIIMAATLTIYINTIKSSADMIKSSRSNHDLDIVMNLMVEDIRRAGYSGAATISNPNGFANPFTTTASTVRIGTYLTANDCILYTYDADDGDSSDNVIDPNGSLDTNEYYGFRRHLNAATNTHTIQMRFSNVGCDDTTTAWQSITDENTMDVIDLQFSFAAMPAAAATPPLPAYPALNATSRCLNYSDNAATASVTNAAVCTFASAPATNAKIGQKRVVNIRMTGWLVNDNDVVKSLSSSVKVANDRLYRQP